MHTPPSRRRKEVMENGQPGPPLDTAGPPAPAGPGDLPGKLESGIAQLITAEAWNIRKSLSPMVGVPTAPPLVGPSVEPPGGVALNLAATVLQPICLGESPVVLPIHVQMAGSSTPQLGQLGSASYLVPGQGPVSLPLVLEQQMFQHLNPAVLQGQMHCPTVPLQGGSLCQSGPVPYGQGAAVDQKPASQAPDMGLLPLLQSPGFAAILQDLFPSHSNLSSSGCHAAGPASNPADHFAPPFFPSPPLMHPYSSPLSPLVPPATLLVPYPVIVPLPVPLPVPIPVPIPVPQSTEPKATTASTSRSTQTSAEPPSAGHPHRQEAIPRASQLVSSCCFPVPEGEALDLSLKALPIQTKQETPFPQDGILDLSVASVRKSCIQSFHSRDVQGAGSERGGRHPSKDAAAGLSLEVLRPAEGTDKFDSKLLSGLASLEFSRHHKWLVDGSGRLANEPKCSAGGSSTNFEIVSTSQTAKVIVSVKDAVPAIFCGKIKGLSGVSTKNFSIRQDANQEALLQHCYGARHPVEPCGPVEALKKVTKSRAIKLKKVNSQEIHILPIKKQRLAAFFPRK